MGTSAWSTQQLAEFVAAVSTAQSETSAAIAAVERAAEALDADVAAIVCGDELVAAVGYPDGTAPVGELAAVKPELATSSLEVPGVGACAATAASLEHPPGATLVLARPAPDSLTLEEAGLLRGMARVASMTMRTLRVLDNERAARAELERLARDQAAVGRVATCVAEGAPPDDVYAAVAHEIAQRLGADVVTVLRYEADGTATIVGGWAVSGMHVPLGARLAVEGQGVAVSVLDTRRPARVERFDGPPGSIAAHFRDLGVHAGVGCPIVVEHELWGVAIAASKRPEALPAGSEARIAEFTELVAMAIANAEARDELRRVADEQAALRRVATLVAEARPPAAVFAAVAEEVGRLVPADCAFVSRYEADQSLTIVAAWSATGAPMPESISVGASYSQDTPSVSRLVRETGRPARMDSYPEDRSGRAIPLGIHSSVGAPITVEGRQWGVMAVASTGDKEPAPPGTEARLAGFSELVATAIANAEAQAELTASRARIIASADETRRRIERDLHDGAQQRLVSLALQLRAAQASVPPDLDELAAELDRVTAGLDGALDELREFARGIHPANLAEGGLRAALKMLARRSAVPVQLDLRTESRLPEPVEVAAYYIVCEALTNAVKHAQAATVAVLLEADDDVLRVRVTDDGLGGASFAGGSGLVGLTDRVEALGGRFALRSDVGAGTSLSVELPLPRDATAAA